MGNGRLAGRRLWKGSLLLGGGGGRWWWSDWVQGEGPELTEGMAEFEGIEAMDKTPLTRCFQVALSSKKSTHTENIFNHREGPQNSGESLIHKQTEFKATKVWGNRFCFREDLMDYLLEL